MRGFTSGRRLVGSVAAVLLTTGCVAEAGGRAALREPPSHLLAPLPSPSVPPPPPRPAEMPLDGVDPCALLGREDRIQLGIDRPPVPGVENGFGEAATCSLRSAQNLVGARLALVTIEGVGVWTDDTAQVEVDHVSSAGFPALVVRTPGQEGVCNVEVDVAEGQFLDVLYRDDGASPPPGLDQLCAGAERVAEIVTANLRERSGVAAEEHETAPPSG
ncbi:DUF3558 domain-containing protein [Actinoalloteichus sp. AHMU CJ021]|uniref:DUF3558 domain-containing protein n=1 Tax=Actinoalloteichus TaxID=65496 RepID=UPI000CA0877A|nr:DUF3558 domain-containing protein [Actinoalloteichus sp. AHMU CJ021]